MQSVWLQVRGKYYALFDENRKLKKDQDLLLASLKTREERVKELEEQDVKVQEDREKNSKELMLTQQNKHIETSDKAIQTNSMDAKVSNNMHCLCIKRFICSLIAINHCDTKLLVS